MTQNLQEKKSNISLSFVVPMFNETECLEELYARIRNVCEDIGASFEMICVNDGSTDGTLAALKELRDKDSRVKILAFSRNFGHQIAIAAGLRYVSGDCAVILDADLQDPPELVREMVEQWKKGFKVVYGVRRKREGDFILRMFYVAYYRILNKISTLSLPMDAGDFCLMDRRVVKEMNRFYENGQYVRGLRAWVGFSQTGVLFDRPRRHKGTTKYSYSKLFKLAVDGILSFSTLPLKLSVYFGIALGAASFSYGVRIAIMRLKGIYEIPGWAGIMVTMTFLMSVQFIVIGLIGEYVGRIHYQTKERPLFIVEEAIGFDGEK